MTTACWVLLPSRICCVYVFRLLTAFAEEQATGDAIYYLGEALRRGVIDLDVFLKVHICRPSVPITRCSQVSNVAHDAFSIIYGNSGNYR